MAKAKPEPAEGVSKMKLVQDAMTELGGDPGPKEMIEHIKAKHGVELKYALVASYKSQILNKKGRTASRAAAASGSVNMKDLQTVKDLLNRLGESQLQSVIKALR